MKWTSEQVARLRELCDAGTPNKDIAAEFGIPTSVIYAKRSQLGITIDKVLAAKDAVKPKDPVKAQKARFIRDLWQGIGFYYPDIDYMEYRVLDNGEEIVQLKYINGSGLGVRVTADSLSAMLRDVARHL